MLVQETFLAFNKTYGNAKKLPRNIHAVLRKTLWNKIFDLLRRRMRDRAWVGDGDPDLMAASARDPEQALLGAERADVARKILAQLPPIWCLILFQVLVYGMTAEEVAQSLKCPPATVRVRLKRAKERVMDLATRVYKLDVGGKTR